MKFTWPPVLSRHWQNGLSAAHVQFFVRWLMSGLESLQAELTLKLSEIDAICADYGYDATPTLLLRHSKGASSSILMGNDSLGKVVLTIAELGDTCKKSDQSPTEAILTLFKGGR